MLRRIFSLTLITLVNSRPKMESKIVKGERVPIESYGHSAFLIITDTSGSFVCGSSVVNQKILLTAAHCIDSCDNKCLDAAAYTGSSNKRQGNKIPILATLTHAQFSRQRIQNDIGLVLLKSALPLGKLIKRVAIMRNPPSAKTATVAGWGLVNEVQNIHTDHLHSVEQTVWYLEDCREMIPTIPNGTICAGDVENQRYASEGDSGSALIIKKYIQIGIVSYKRPDISRAIVVYTEVANYYDWIKNNSKKLYCDHLPS